MPQTERRNSTFYLNKWYLDLITPTCEAAIVYAAALQWHGWTLPYTSWLLYTPQEGVQHASRFSKLQLPEVAGTQIHWSDPVFDAAGSWEALASPLQARIFESEAGNLDWHCHQPLSLARLRIGGHVLEGRGYAEQITMTTPPWHFPMDELRWGHFCGEKEHAVWIEIREKIKRQWVWINGQPVAPCDIEDTGLSMPTLPCQLSLNPCAVLESEQKIFAVTGNLLRYIPGLSRIIPLPFLMAHNQKWLSTAQLSPATGAKTVGMAIHERVDFRDKNSH